MISLLLIIQSKIWRCSIISSYSLELGLLGSIKLRIQMSNKTKQKNNSNIIDMPRKTGSSKFVWHRLIKRNLHLHTSLASFTDYFLKINRNFLCFLSLSPCKHMLSVRLDKLPEFEKKALVLETVRLCYCRSKSLGAQVDTLTVWI